MSGTPKDGGVKENVQCLYHFSKFSPNVTRKIDRKIVYFPIPPPVRNAGGISSTLTDFALIGIFNLPGLTFSAES